MNQPLPSRSRPSGAIDGPAYTAYMVRVLGAILEDIDNPRAISLTLSRILADCPYPQRMIVNELDRALSYLDTTH